jgi:hypothetical protein
MMANGVYIVSCVHNSRTWGWCTWCLCKRPVRRIVPWVGASDWLGLQRGHFYGQCGHQCWAFCCEIGWKSVVFDGNMAPGRVLRTGQIEADAVWRVARSLWRTGPWCWGPSLSVTQAKGYMGGFLGLRPTTYRERRFLQTHCTGIWLRRD